METNIPPSSMPSHSVPELDPADGGGRKIFDRTGWAIIAGFACLALVAAVVMHDGYRRNQVTTASDKYYNSRQYAQAIPYLREITNRFPDAWVRMKMLGDCYLLAIDHNDTKQAKEYARAAEDCYNRVLASPVYKQALADSSLTPDARQDMDLNEELGICASELGDEKAALDYFNKVTAQEPDSPAANFYQGVQLFNTGHYQLAARCFQNAAHGDQALPGNDNDPEAPKASRWGDRWDKLSEPYRKEIAKRVLEAPLAPTPTPTPEKKAGKG